MASRASPTTGRDTLPGAPDAVTPASIVTSLVPATTRALSTPRMSSSSTMTRVVLPPSTATPRTVFSACTTPAYVTRMSYVPGEAGPSKLSEPELYDSWAVARASAIDTLQALATLLPMKVTPTLMPAGRSPRFTLTGVSTPATTVTGTTALSDSYCLWSTMKVYAPAGNAAVSGIPENGFRISVPPASTCTSTSALTSTPEAYARRITLPSRDPKSSRTCESSPDLADTRTSGARRTIEPSTSSPLT